MFRLQVRRTPLTGAFILAGQIFHGAVRTIRKTNGNAVAGLLINILQAALMIAIFFVMMNVMGMRRFAIRGDFLLYVMSGIFLFMTHTKTMGAVSGAEGPTSTMMQHAPMNPVIAIASAALGTLYIQLLTCGVILYLYHVIFQPITIYEPVGAMGMVLLGWASGVAVGMIFYAARPWQPETVAVLSQIYQRANMIASGKMFLGNMMTAKMLAMFDWNPLFHVIDQARGYVFLNYHPHNSNWHYALEVTVVCFAIGLMGIFYTRKHASLSWGAKR